MLSDSYPQSDNLTKKLDEFDRFILYKLVQNGRIPYSHIARDMKKSVQFVQFRVKRMHRWGFYLGDVLMLDMSKLGYRTYHLYLQVRQHTGKESDLIQQVVQYFSDHCGTAAIQKMIGRYQVYMAITAHNIQEVETMLIGAVDKFRNVITEYRIMNLYRGYSLAHNFLFPDKELIYQNETLFASPKIDLSDKDMKMIKALNENPRMTFSALGKKIKSQRDTVKRMYKRLVREKVILRIRPSINPATVGYIDKHIKFKIKFRGLDKLKEIRDHLISLRETKFLVFTFGNYDLSLNIIFNNIHELESFQREFDRKFGDIISHISYHDYYEEVKFKYNLDTLI
ncbi:AsnC family transcriptional regulator [Candidatus Woesearchaeota archaeon]|jgi:Lrp/AsnC family transcriptional regulator, regulator for asnA, asnC and gidA|nr:AsnC family transcriptional regulator [Candidatus Woesearchaeota archaeon]MBT4151411.1 AsnC family transcriptional regulator [Candidatus Woesearchaeota archaeon]MBT4247809.1 AsnC family transcriptional regulator [Candidatus Woesearchaeota archaeon]MBT4434233.1 AsnC family transcriptional regulator [Candidatus Woesearchaeota archaeon]MBT7331846.1 AsnC family transcriptional regulator [Candidatus Woesearchaeota archaeon]